MKSYVLDCFNVRSEKEFWDLYIETTKPEGEAYFGKNIPAFFDALSAGGPGYPEECTLVIKNYKAMLGFNGGKLVKGLLSVSNRLHSVVSDSEITIKVM